MMTEKNLQLKVVLIGAGNRGKAYTDIMADMPEKFKVTAVVEPIRNRREYIRDKHNIPENMCFEEWNSLFELGKIADVAIISTMDRDHLEPALKAIELKYDLLLEKPMAPTPEDCRKIALCAEKNGIKVLVCHVLRYTKIFNTLKSIIDSGKIGDVVSVNHEECVGNVHQTHSFVRGNWGNSDRSSCMILQKSCHDMDILQWLIGKKCLKVQSFGGTKHFCIENAPENAPDYCIEGCPVGETCPYNAVKIYLDDKENDWFRTTCTKEVYPTDEDVKNAITNTQYGKCVYKCDNNVVDHQVVNLLFEDGVTVTFSMNAFNRGGRFIHIMGTKGELHASMDGGEPIRIYDFETKENNEYTMESILGTGNIADGHGGGDTGIIENLYDFLMGTYSGKSCSNVMETYQNHLISFAAEESRLISQVVDFNEYAMKIEENFK